MLVDRNKTDKDKFIGVLREIGLRFDVSENFTSECKIGSSISLVDINGRMINDIEIDFGKDGKCLGIE